MACHYRYTTYERVERPSITIIKKDNTRQLYDRAKLVAGLQKACEKTTITGEEFDALVSRIENQIYDCGDVEIASTRIGSIIMDTLADVNQIAYVRFASVYRNFTDLASFEQELSHIKARVHSPDNALNKNKTH